MLSAWCNWVADASGYSILKSLGTIWAIWKNLLRSESEMFLHVPPCSSKKRLSAKHPPETKCVEPCTTLSTSFNPKGTHWFQSHTDSNCQGLLVWSVSTKQLRRHVAKTILDEISGCRILFWNEWELWSLQGFKDGHAGICAQLQGSLFDAPCLLSLLSTMKISAVASGVPRIEQIVWIWSMKSLPLNLKHVWGAQVGKLTEQLFLGQSAHF